MKRLIASIALVAASFAVLTPQVEAAKPAPVGILVLNEADQSLAFGDTLTFTSSYQRVKGSDIILVYVECRSVIDGSVLYGQIGDPDIVFTLRSALWTSHREDAVCQAYLHDVGKQGGLTVLATTPSFTVDGGI